MTVMRILLFFIFCYTFSHSQVFFTVFYATLSFLNLLEQSFVKKI